MTLATAFESPPVLLSIASKQVWPHILAVAHLKPSQLILLHSDDASESRTPAQRLKKFFYQRSSMVPKPPILERMPHDDFAAVERRLNDIAKNQKLNLPDCALNFTGGNKLMATAAFHWAAQQGVKSFYLERENRLTWFIPSGEGFNSHAAELDGGITNDLNPVALLRCQLDASEVERDGERLTLTDVGRGLSDGEFRKRIANGSIDGLMEQAGTGDRQEKEGDGLELSTAAVLLKLGVTEVQRSLLLKVNTSSGVSSRRPHAEIDLLFNWNGRLWLVDCKDRISEEERMKALRRALPERISNRAQNLLDVIESDLKISPTKVLKEDLVAINEMGGLLGQVVCVRKRDLPAEAKEYAKRNRIELVLKSEMFQGFDRLLHGDRPASAASLINLENRFSSSHKQ